MPTLRQQVPGQRPRAFPLFKRITSIGRAVDNDVVVPETTVADHAAQIVFDGRDFNITEVDRAAEFLVNGKKKRRLRLTHSDRLQFGSVELTFSIYDETLPESEPSEGGGGGEELRGLRKLHDFSRRLMERHELGALLDVLLDSVIEITHADKGFLILIEDGRPDVKVARNIRRESIQDAVLHLSDSIIRTVIEKKEPIIVSDALHDQHFASSQSVINLKLCSVMCAPLLEQGNLLGLIYVGNDSVVNLFEKGALELLTIFAGQASLIVRSALVLDQLKSDNEALKGAVEERRFGDLIGSAPAMLDVFKKVQKVAGTDVSVLITGETGTGKELIARELHRRSGRVKGPFVTINCGAIPENLMESELFGHVKGAFTGAVASRPGKFQTADGGTLFLDEIGELPLNLQVKLLRALQEKVVVRVGENRPEPVDIRVVAATNRHLEEEVRKGGFREDLFYRLNVVQVHLPPMRDRGEDVVVLAKYLLQKFTEEFNRKVAGFTPNALIAIRKYDWPGNVRQLENRIKKAVVLADKTMVGPEDLDLSAEELKPVLPLAEAREEWQSKYVQEVLERNGGNRTKTARDLGVDPRTIFRYLEKEEAERIVEGEG